MFKCFYSLLKIHNFRNILHFLKRILQVVDIAEFWQNVLLYFENDPLSTSFWTFSIVVTWHTKYGRGSKHLKETWIEQTR